MDKNDIQKILESSVTQIESLKNVIEKMKDDYEFAQIIKQDDKMYSFKEAADILGNDLNLGRNKLFEWLRLKNILCSSKSNHNLPYREFIERGYFDVKIKNTPVGVKSVAFFTIKGIEWIIKVWRKENE
jgi:phage antirepressor YoqD-like protein